MSEMYENGPFSLLPDRRPPWKQFMLTMGMQGIALFVLAWAAVLNLAVLDQPVRDYHFVRLVETPPPEIHEPAPVQEIPPPRVVAHVETPPAEVLRVPAPEVKPKAPPEETLVAPQVEIAATKPVPLPPVAPVIPKQLVKTHVFSTGSSAVPTIAEAPKNVQTGGFGDPNGVAARETNTKAVNIGPSGAFDLPTGPGSATAPAAPRAFAAWWPAAASEAALPPARQRQGKHFSGQRRTEERLWRHSSRLHGSTAPQANRRFRRQDGSRRSRFQAHSGIHAGSPKSCGSRVRSCSRWSSKPPASFEWCA